MSDVNYDKDNPYDLKEPALSGNATLNMQTGVDQMRDKPRR